MTEKEKRLNNQMEIEKQIWSVIQDHAAKITAYEIMGILASIIHSIGEGKTK